MKILDTATTSETITLIGAGLFLIAGVFFSTAEFKYIFSLIFNVGFKPDTALSIAALQIPGTIVWTLPTAIVVATGFVLMRRVYEGEMIGLALSGINPTRAFMPLLFVGLVASVGSFMLRDTVVPSAQALSNRLLCIGALNSELPRNRDFLMMERSSGKSKDTDRIFFIGKYNKQNLENVIVLDLCDPNLTKVTWSPTGTWERGRWVLKDGRIYELSQGERTRRATRFGTMYYDGINVAATEMMEKGPFTQEITAAALAAQIKEIEARGGTPPASLLGRFFRRYSQPASCFFVALAALPLVVPRRKRSMVSGCAYIGIIVLLFFITQQITMALADHGRMAPLVAAWFPAAIVAVTGIAGFYFRLRAR